MPPSPTLSRLLSHMRKGYPWTSLATVERAARRHRRSVIGILRELEEHGILEMRPRNVAAGKAGAT